MVFALNLMFLLAMNEAFPFFMTERLDERLILEWSEKHYFVYEKMVVGGDGFDLLLHNQSLKFVSHTRGGCRLWV